MEPETVRAATLRDLWLVLPVVAEIFDEQSVTVEEALEHLNDFLGPGPRSPELQQALGRLRSAKDEFTFREMLSGEWLESDSSIDR